MNIQTEQLENHRARFTVEVETERLEEAKQKAARKIAKQVRIPGFRKGKVPYRILIQNGLESAILEEAVEELSQVIYRETLEQAEIDPYGPGAFENFKFEGTPVFVYSVPLQPTVKLGEYRAIRKEFIEPEVTDEEVAGEIKQMLHSQAEVTESEAPVALGDRVTLDIHSVFADDAPEVAEGEESEDAEASVPPQKGDHFIHQHDAHLYLDPDEEVVLPGFKEQLIGANIGDELSFELEVPTDHADYEEIGGRHIQFNISIEKVESMVLPELNDEFAAKVGESLVDGATTLEELHEKTRQNLLDEKLTSVKDAFALEMLDEIVTISEFAYPEEMIEEQINDMLKDFERRLQQSRMDLETYYKITGTTREDILKDYRAPAEFSIRRSLALREIISAEHLRVTDVMIDEQIDEVVAQFGSQVDAIRGMFDTPQMRLGLANDLLQKMALERITAIGRGEDIPEPTVADMPTEAPDDEAIVVDESPAEVEEEPQVDVRETGDET